MEDKNGRAEAQDVVPGSPKKTMSRWIWVAVGIFAGIGILQFILRAVFFLRG